MAAAPAHQPRNPGHLHGRAIQAHDRARACCRPTEDWRVFLCVDSIQGRRLIWEVVREHAGFVIDGRMSAEVVRVLAVARQSLYHRHRNSSW